MKKPEKLQQRNGVCEYCVWVDQYRRLRGYHHFRPADDGMDCAQFQSHYWLSVVVKCA